LITGFKAEIIAGLMTKEGQLNTIALIKVEAREIELMLEEKRKICCGNERIEWLLTWTENNLNVV
jgi:hypothetical protein